MKKTILIIAILILCHTISPAKQFKLFLNTGGSFATHPKFFRDDKKPCMIVGGGFGLELSKRLTIQASFNYCSFYPRDKYFKWLGIGDSFIDISHWNWYKGNHFESFYNLMVDARYFILIGRVSSYIIGSMGYIFERWVSGGSMDIFEGETLYITWRGGPAAGAGLGIEYRFNRKFGIFVETQYNVFWYKSAWKKGVFNLGFAPLKIGVNYYL
jgi:hypothetical protein